jgi:hypothetical protein
MSTKWCTLGSVSTFAKEVKFKRQRWVWGPLSLLPSLQGGIRRFCGSETPIFHYAGGEETEANGGHWGDWTLNQTRSRHDRTRPVSDSCCARRGALGFATGASGQAPEKLQKVRGRSDVVARPATIDRTRPVVSGSLLEMIGRWHCGVRFVLRRVWSLARRRGRCVIGASDRGVEHVRSHFTWECNVLWQLKI